MKLRFYGVRGSHATPSRPDFSTIQYGGNTTCLYVETNIGAGEHIIFDAGTGIIPLGQDLIKRFGKDAGVRLFINHLHWDHIQGFPFFAPAWVPGCYVAIYSGHMGVDAALRGKTSVLNKDPDSNASRVAFEGQQDVHKGYFPVPVERMGGSVFFNVHKPNTAINSVSYHYFDETAHPGGIFSYRVDAEGKSIVYVGDYESDNGKNDIALTQFAKDADILVLDGQYTDAEYATKKGWGHNTVRRACMLGMFCNAKTLVITHHDPSHDDWKLGSMEAEAKQLLQSLRSGINVCFAKEGMTLEA